MTPAELKALMSRRPAILAPMEDVTDVVFRRLCREFGADLTVTEFVRADNLVRGDKLAVRKVQLAADDLPTAIQIYGSNPTLLAEAARLAEAAKPAFVDINCGCWVPKVARGGAGAGWLRNPTAMVEMAKLVVGMVALPVTVKTRIGWGPESEMPIVDLARRLEDVGVQALTVHCRTAQQGHTGAADWSWARRAREVVSIPVVVNGDVRSADDAERALAETGCAGVMVGRQALEAPWVFREIRSWLDHGVRLPSVTVAERLAVYRRIMNDNVAVRGRLFGVRVTRRHCKGLLAPLPELWRPLLTTDDLDACMALLAEAEQKKAA